jgi:hypothetical protein
MHEEYAEEYLLDGEEEEGEAEDMTGDDADDEEESDLPSEDEEV